MQGACQKAKRAETPCFSKSLLFMECKYSP